MPFIVCESCQGTGKKKVKRARLKDGKMTTEEVTEDCKHCLGSGVISQ